ncbi:glyoxalase superfamily protein [Algoriphagus sp. NG3]|uniref:glyoxalase superfamily protein n=1 Tax=Algoriphagus sp. NG3 TaxID=3097546 RepID=UPI002A83D3A9|nr:glyoxalase superfamily protein [Algoriphagus sp. NG3]WPR77751.1 glyoxalase superfamily protein [Algoriphagus sp. NG3]
MITDQRVIPILKIVDVIRAKEFYVDMMGFEVEWEKKSDEKSSIYMILSYKHIILYFTDYDEVASESSVFIEFSGLKEYQGFLLERKAEYMIADLNMTPWESLSMEVVDPFGNKLLFCEPFNG